MTKFGEGDMSLVDEFAKWLYLWNKVEEDDKRSCDSPLPEEKRDNEKFLLDVTQKAMDYMSSGAGTLEELQEQLDIISGRVLQQTMEFEAAAKANGRTSLEELFEDYAPSEKVQSWLENQTMTGNVAKGVTMDAKQEGDQTTTVNTGQMNKETVITSIPPPRISTLDEFTITSHKKSELNEEDRNQMAGLDDSGFETEQAEIKHLDITDQTEVPETKNSRNPSAVTSTFGKIRLFFKKKRSSSHLNIETKPNRKSDKPSRSVRKMLIGLLSCGGGARD